MNELIDAREERDLKMLSLFLTIIDFELEVLDESIKDLIARFCGALDIDLLELNSRDLAICHEHHIDVEKVQGIYRYWFL